MLLMLFQQAQCAAYAQVLDTQRQCAGHGILAAFL
jgi:hypothetical protein